MSEEKFDESHCECCGQPLFLDKKECKDFIEDRMKEGFIVCSCCGSKQEAK